MAKEVIGNGNPDGTTLGRATTEKISFYGVTPVAQQATITDITNTATGTEIATAVNALIARLKTVGLIA